MSPILEEYELVKIYLQWQHIDPEKKNSYVDMNAHVDVHLQGKDVRELHAYNIERDGADYGIEIKDHLDCNNKEQISEITFYDDVNSYGNSYHIYLYAYCNTFKEVSAKCQIYRRDNDNVHFYLSEKGILYLSPYPIYSLHHRRTGEQAVADLQDGG